MNVEIGAEAVLFPEKEYINGIAVAVYTNKVLHIQLMLQSLHPIRCVGVVNVHV